MRINSRKGDVVKNQHAGEGTPAWTDPGNAVDRGAYSLSKVEGSIRRWRPFLARPSVGEDFGGASTWRSACG